MVQKSDNWVRTKKTGFTSELCHNAPRYQSFSLIQFNILHRVVVNLKCGRGKYYYEHHHEPHGERSALVIDIPSSLSLDDALLNVSEWSKNWPPDMM